MQTFRFRVAPLVSATFTLTDDTLTYAQGARRRTIPLAQVRAFGVRARPAFLGFASSPLYFLVDRGDGARPRRLSTTVDPAQPAYRALLAALGARLPAADTTALPWPDAAARLGTVARPWYEDFLHPRAIIGVVLLGANAASASTMSASQDRDERLGAGLFALAITVLAIALIVSGVRRSRARRAGS